MENAIKHGISKRRGDVVIEVDACRENGSLRMSVRDNGVGLHDEGSTKEGVGLSSTRARLRELYGEKQSFVLSNVASGGADATVIMPFSSVKHHAAPEE